MVVIILKFQARISRFPVINGVSSSHPQPTGQKLDKLTWTGNKHGVTRYSGKAQTLLLKLHIYPVFSDIIKHISTAPKDMVDF